MVNFTQSFYFRGHLCISTELLDMNLYEFIKSNAFKGFSLKIVRRFTKQMLSSLLLLKQHKVIHCDLKPENILLSDETDDADIKVTDFGLSKLYSTDTEVMYTQCGSPEFVREGAPSANGLGNEPQRPQRNEPGATPIRCFLFSE